MVHLLILGLFLLVGVIFLIRWMTTADPRAVAKVLRWTAIVGGTALILFLTVTGRLPAVMGLLWFLAPLLLRWRAIANRMKAASGPSPHQRSGLETTYLRVELDHDSGRMDGEVRRGPFVGRTLGSMSLQEVLALLAECNGADSQSVPVLEAFLDRQFGPSWRNGTAGADDGFANGYGPGSDGWAGDGGRSSGADRPMTRDEAYRILGLSPDADKDSIKRAHRQLMKKLHPDHGGSDYLAAKLNQAKDLLLNS